jgi:hypothetical protein
VSAHSGRAHAKLSPSAAHRWIECPGSIAACEGIPSKSSRFADEGTAAHTLAEFCFAGKVDADTYAGDYVDIGVGKLLPRDLVGHPGAQGIFEVTEEMTEAVQVYLDFIRPLCEGAEVEAEAKLDLTSIPGMEFGTGDFCAYNPTTKDLDIVDLKYGKGVLVRARDNPQLLTYALGVARRYHNRGVRRVRCTIVQPRRNHVDTAEYNGVDLLEFEADLTTAAIATTAPDAPRKAGEWCKFCPAGPGCTEFANAATAAAVGAFSEPADDGLSTISLMGADDLASALRKAHILKAWLKRMEEFAHSEAMAGRLPTGFKLVPKRAVRRWRDEGETIARLANADVDPWEKKLISPAAAEKLLGKKRASAILEPLVVRESFGTNLVPVEDPREPARPDVEGVFEALT